MLEKFNQEMIQAMKDKNKVKLNTLRAVKGAMQLEKINNKKEENDELLLDVVNKQIKMRNDSIEEFSKANRTDLVDSVKKEVEVLMKYLPEQLELSEVEEIITSAIESVEASSMKDMGKVMQEVRPKVNGRFDMKKVSEIIKGKLS